MTPTRDSIYWAVRDCETGRRDVVWARTVDEAVVAGARLFGAPVELVEVAPTQSCRGRLGAARDRF